MRAHWKLTNLEEVPNIFGAAMTLFQSYSSFQFRYRYSPIAMHLSTIGDDALAMYPTLELGCAKASASSQCRVL